MIKRKDGSYSKRGLWDNIRANKGSGKEPTKEMLKQESKIKKEENMKSMYKKGGKTSKKKVMKEARKEGESFMEESKEIGFGAPGVKPPVKYDLGGLTNGNPKKNSDGNYKIAKGYRDVAPKAEEKMNKFMDMKNPLTDDAKGTYGPEFLYKRRTLKGVLQGADTVKEAQEDFDEKYTKASKKRNGGMIETGMEANGRQNRAEGKATMAGKKKMYKTGGAKTMEPGGGGRFAKMVSGLKKEGKSEESAEAIAASAGRKKYGKSKFQAMAAAGKKKMMGGKKC
jgi:hypothetical protein